VLFTFSKWNWIFVVPPLSINEAELREGLRILDEVLDITDTEAQ
jgi:taurine--2-oxoglutarate transaminase